VVGHRNVCRPTQLWLLKDRRVEAQDLRGLEMSVDHSAFQYPYCERPEPPGDRDDQQLESTDRCGQWHVPPWEILTETAQYQAPTWDLPPPSASATSLSRQCLDSYIRQPTHTITSSSLSLLECYNCYSLAYMCQSAALSSTTLTVVAGLHQNWLREPTVTQSKS